MVIRWIQSHGKKTSSYAINVDSKAALLAIANRHTTHPLAVVIREKVIKPRNSTSITFHWVKGHAGQRGNERTDYLAKTAASYITTIAYDEIPINRGKQILEDHYVKIWNEIAACWDPYREGQISALDRVQKKAAKFAHNRKSPNWETLASRRKLSRICALFKAYSGERAWKSIGDRLQRPHYLSRVDHLKEN